MNTKLDREYKLNIYKFFQGKTKNKNKLKNKKKILKTISIISKDKLTRYKEFIRYTSIYWYFKIQQSKVYL